MIKWTRTTRLSITISLSLFLGSGQCGFAGGRRSTERAHHRLPASITPNSSPQREGQIVFYTCLDLYRKSPDLGGRHCKSPTWKRRFDPAGMQRTVRVCGREAKHLRPNEHTIAFQMQTAIWATRSARDILPPFHNFKSPLELFSILLKSSSEPFKNILKSFQSPFKTFRVFYNLVHVVEMATRAAAL